MGINPQARLPFNSGGFAAWGIGFKLNHFETFDYFNKNVSADTDFFNGDFKRPDKANLDK